MKILLQKALLTQTDYIMTPVTTACRFLSWRRRIADVLNVLNKHLLIAGKWCRAGAC